MFGNHNAHVVTFKTDPIAYEIYSTGDALAEGKITSGEYTIIMNRLQDRCNAAERSEQFYCINREDEFFDLRRAAA